MTRNDFTEIVNDSLNFGGGYFACSWPVVGFGWAVLAGVGAFGSAVVVFTLLRIIRQALEERAGTTDTNGGR